MKIEAKDAQRLLLGPDDQALGYVRSLQLPMVVTFDAALIGMNMFSMDGALVTQKKYSKSIESIADLHELEVLQLMRRLRMLEEFVSTIDIAKNKINA